MTIAKLKGTPWVTGEPISPAQINQLNDLLPLLMDMVHGSTHTPDSTIYVLGPAGMNINTLIAGQADVGTLTVDTGLYAGSIAFTGPETPTIAVPLIAGGTTLWQGPVGTGAGQGTCMQQTSVAGSDECILQLPALPRGCTITGIVATVQPAATHASLPATMPAILLDWVNPGVATIHNINSQIDSSASPAAYNALHTINLSCSHTYDCTKPYRVRIRGESGANSATSGGVALQVFGLQVQISASGLHL